MAKLYLNPEFGTVVARPDDDKQGLHDMIELTAEQATAISLSVIGQMLSNLYDVFNEKLPNFRRERI